MQFSCAGWWLPLMSTFAHRFWESFLTCSQPRSQHARSTPSPPWRYFVTTVRKRVATHAGGKILCIEERGGWICLWYTIVFCLVVHVDFDNCPLIASTAMLMMATGWRHFLTQRKQRRLHRRRPLSCWLRRRHRETIEKILRSVAMMTMAFG